MGKPVVAFDLGGSSEKTENEMDRIVVSMQIKYLEYKKGIYHHNSACVCAVVECH